MKPFGYYDKPQTLYPNKKDYITFYVYDKGACIYSESALSNTKSALKEDYPNAVIQEVVDEEIDKIKYNIIKDIINEDLEAL